MPQLHDEIWRYRRKADLAAHTVSAEVFSFAHAGIVVLPASAGGTPANLGAFVGAAEAANGGIRGFRHSD